MRAQGLWQSAGAMSVGTALSRLTGLLRVAALTYALGVTGTRLADTYNLANTTPNIIYELFLGGILTSVFVPVLIATRERDGRDVSALVSVFLVALAVIAAIAAIAAPVVMRIYTFRIEDPLVRAAQLDLATFLLRWFAPQIFFYGLSAVAQAFLNVRGRFALPAFAPVANNIAVAATFFGFAAVVASPGLELSTGAKTLLGAGTTAGVALQALILLPALRRERLRFRPSLRDPAVTQVMRLSAYVIGYVVINQVGLWVVLALANGVRGGVTSWQVAFIFFQLPHGLFAVSIYTALFPALARSASASDWEGFRRTFQAGLRAVAFLLVPSAIGYAIVAGPITRLLLARGVADVADAEAVASVLRVFALGLVGFATFHLLTRSFYAIPDTRTPTALNAAAVSLNIAIDIPLFTWIGVRGLALGHAIAYTAGAVLLAIVLHRRIPGGLRLQRLIGPIARIMAASTAMGAGVWAVSVVLDTSDIVLTAACVGTGAILYLAFSQVAGVEERRDLLDMVRRRGGRA